MEDLKNKSKQELLEMARLLANQHNEMKATITKMLDELDLIEAKYNEVANIIKG